VPSLGAPPRGDRERARAPSPEREKERSESPNARAREREVRISSVPEGGCMCALAFFHRSAHVFFFVHISFIGARIVSIFVRMHSFILGQPIYFT